MVRLSRTQRKVLAAVIPIDGKMGFRKAIDDGAIDLALSASTAISLGGT